MKRSKKARKKIIVIMVLILVFIIPVAVFLAPWEESQAVSCYNWKTKEKYSKSRLTICLQGKALGLSGTPLVIKEDVDMFPLSYENCKKISGLSYEYNERTKHATVVYRNHVVTFVAGKKKYYADGIRHTFRTAPVKVYYNKPQKYYIAAPAKELFTALAMKTEQEEGSRHLDLFHTKVDVKGEKIYTAYAYKKALYAQKQYKKFPKTSIKNYKKLFSPSKDKTGKFQFLVVNTYREVDEEYYNAYVDYKIYDYCLEAGISVKKSVLYGKGNQLLKTAKKYNIDPVYFACQTFVESAYGTSVLACGVRSGQKKVYNLYGIKAYDGAPIKKGAAYAKKKGWTTVNKAIDGAAAYLASGYINSKYKQNTIFKIRYNPGKSLWHQYASDPFYPQKIGTAMFQMSHVYASEAEFTFDYPRF